MLAVALIGVQRKTYACGCYALVWPAEGFGASSTGSRTSLLCGLLKRGQATLVCDELIGGVFERHDGDSGARGSAIKGIEN
jgi:hypothetical protein